VDPPDINAQMVGKLLLPFPLLSDPRGELIKRYGLWDEEEGVARPSIAVVDRSREVRYLYSGSDFADRPGDKEVFAALEGLDGQVQRVMGDPEIRVLAEEARHESVRPESRPDRPATTLDYLTAYYRGVFRTTVALKKRFGGWGRSGREAFREVGRYQTMVQRYRKALEQTVELRRAE
jgi:AhpC/TSA family